MLKEFVSFCLRVGGKITRISGRAVSCRLPDLPEDLVVRYENGRLTIFFGGEKVELDNVKVVASQYASGVQIDEHGGGLSRRPDEIIVNEADDGFLVFLK